MYEETICPSGGVSIGEDHSYLLYAGCQCVNKAVDWDSCHGSITSSGDSLLDDVFSMRFFSALRFSRQSKMP